MSDDTGRAELSDMYIYIYIYIYIYSRFACGPIRGQRSCTLYNSHNVLPDALECVCCRPSTRPRPDQSQTWARPRPDQSQTKARPDRPDQDQPRTRPGPRPAQDQPKPGPAQDQPRPEQDQTGTSPRPARGQAKADQPKNSILDVKLYALRGLLATNVHFDL